MPIVNVSNTTLTLEKRYIFLYIKRLSPPKKFTDRMAVGISGVTDNMAVGISGIVNKMATLVYQVLLIRWPQE